MRELRTASCSGSVVEFRRVQHLHEPRVSQNETAGVCEFCFRAESDMRCRAAHLPALFSFHRLFDKHSLLSDYFHLRPMFYLIGNLSEVIAC